MDTAAGGTDWQHKASSTGTIFNDLRVDAGLHAEQITNPGAVLQPGGLRQVGQNQWEGSRQQHLEGVSFEGLTDQNKLNLVKHFDEWSTRVKKNSELGADRGIPRLPYIPPVDTLVMGGKTVPIPSTLGGEGGPALTSQLEYPISSRTLAPLMLRSLEEGGSKEAATKKIWEMLRTMTLASPTGVQPELTAGITLPSQGPGTTPYMHQAYGNLKITNESASEGRWSGYKNTDKGGTIYESKAGKKGRLRGLTSGAAQTFAGMNAEDFPSESNLARLLELDEALQIQQDILDSLGGTPSLPPHGAPEVEVYEAQEKKVKALKSYIDDKKARAMFLATRFKSMEEYSLPQKAAGISRSGVGNAQERDLISKAESHPPGHMRHGFVLPEQVRRHEMTHSLTPFLFDSAMQGFEVTPILDDEEIPRPIKSALRLFQPILGKKPVDPSVDAFRYRNKFDLLMGITPRDTLKSTRDVPSVPYPQTYPSWHPETGKSLPVWDAATRQGLWNKPLDEYSQLDYINSFKLNDADEYGGSPDDSSYIAKNYSDGHSKKTLIEEPWENSLYEIPTRSIDGKMSQELSSVDVTAQGNLEYLENEKATVVEKIRKLPFFAKDRGLSSGLLPGALWKSDPLIDEEARLSKGADGRRKVASPPERELFGRLIAAQELIRDIKAAKAQQSSALDARVNLLSEIAHLDTQIDNLTANNPELVRPGSIRSKEWADLEAQKLLKRAAYDKAMPVDLTLLDVLAADTMETMQRLEHDRPEYARHWLSYREQKFSEKGKTVPTLPIGSGHQDLTHLVSSRAISTREKLSRKLGALPPEALSKLAQGDISGVSALEPAQWGVQSNPDLARFASAEKGVQLTGSENVSLNTGGQLAFDARSRGREFILAEAYDTMQENLKTANVSLSAEDLSALEGGISIEELLGRLQKNPKHDTWAKQQLSTLDPVKLKRRLTLGDSPLSFITKGQELQGLISHENQFTEQHKVSAWLQEEALKGQQRLKDKGFLSSLPKSRRKSFKQTQEVESARYRDIAASIESNIRAQKAEHMNTVLQIAAARDAAGLPPFDRAALGQDAATTLQNAINFEMNQDSPTIEDWSFTPRKIEDLEGLSKMWQVVSLPDRYKELLTQTVQAVQPQFKKGASVSKLQQVPGEAEIEAVGKESKLIQEFMELPPLKEQLKRDLEGKKIVPSAGNRGKGNQRPRAKRTGFRLPWTKASGHVPNFGNSLSADVERAGAYAAGYTPGGIRHQEGFTFNSAEEFIPAFQLEKMTGIKPDGPAIIPPRGSARDETLSTLRERIGDKAQLFAAEGHVPNFAEVSRGYGGDKPRWSDVPNSSPAFWATLLSDDVKTPTDFMEGVRGILGAHTGGVSYAADMRPPSPEEFPEAYDEKWVSEINTKGFKTGGIGNAIVEAALGPDEVFHGGNIFKRATSKAGTAKAGSGFVSYTTDPNVAEEFKYPESAVNQARIKVPELEGEVRKKTLVDSRIFTQAKIEKYVKRFGVEKLKEMISYGLANPDSMSRGAVAVDISSILKNIDHNEKEITAVMGGGHKPPQDHPLMHKSLSNLSKWMDTKTGRPLSYGGVISNKEGKILLRKTASEEYYRSEGKSGKGKEGFGGYGWTFAKGRAEEGEMGTAAARREVLEETGVKGRITGEIPGVFSGSTTDTKLYLMEAEGEPGAFGYETEEVGWFTPEEARERIGSSSRKPQRDLDILDAAIATKSARTDLDNYLRVLQEEGRAVSVYRGHSERSQMGKRGYAQSDAALRGEVPHLENLTPHLQNLEGFDDLLSGSLDTTPEGFLSSTTKPRIAQNFTIGRLAREEPGGPRAQLSKGKALGLTRDDLLVLKKNYEAHGLTFPDLIRDLVSTREVPVGFDMDNWDSYLESHPSGHGTTAIPPIATSTQRAMGRLRGIDASQILKARNIDEYGLITKPDLPSPDKKSLGDVGVYKGVSSGAAAYGEKEILLPSPLYGDNLGFEVLGYEPNKPLDINELMQDFRQMAGIDPAAAEAVHGDMKTIHYDNPNVLQPHSSAILPHQSPLKKNKYTVPTSADQRNRTDYVRQLLEGELRLPRPDEMVYEEPLKHQQFDQFMVDGETVNKGTVLPVPQAGNAATGPQRPRRGGSGFPWKIVRASGHIPKMRASSTQRAPSLPTEEEQKRATQQMEKLTGKKQDLSWITGDLNWEVSSRENKVYPSAGNTARGNQRPQKKGFLSTLKTLFGLKADGHIPQFAAYLGANTKTKNIGNYTPNFSLRDDIKFEDLEKVSFLGGSTGAVQYRDKKTGEFVVGKYGDSQKHIKNEATANKLKEGLGMNVPDSALITDDTGQKLQITEFIEGMTLHDWLSTARTDAQTDQVFDQIRGDFAKIALLGDWDIANPLNTIITPGGKAVHIDAGGALEYRAQGRA